MRYGEREFSKDELLKRVGNPAQLCGTRRVVLDDGPEKGVSAIDVNTGGGLCFTVLADRGLDISRTSYRGTNLVHLGSSGETHPSFYDPHGQGWLRGFYAGLVTTCGLTNFGPPVQDGKEELGQHGRYSNLPAWRVQDRSGWDGGTYRIEITGTIEETVIFGNKLRLARTISTELGSRSIRIHDSVLNFGYKPSPFTILYHFNFGFPLLDASSEFMVTASGTEPRDEDARKGMNDWHEFSDPIPNYAAQVFFHKSATGPDGRACAAILNEGLAGGLGVKIEYDPEELPYTMEWKMMDQGDYVLGIEPANAPVLDRVELREKGLLQSIEPGETRSMTLDVTVLDGREDIAACRKSCKPK